MKLQKLLIISIIGIFIVSCKKDSSLLQQKPIGELDLILFASSPFIETTPTQAIISITNATSDTIIKKHHFSMNLIEDNKYGIEKLSLDTGHYEIVEFKVFDENGDEIYYTPNVNSQFEKNVSNPLPYAFCINQDSLTLDTIESIPSKSILIGLKLYESFNFLENNNECPSPAKDINNNEYKAAYFKNQCFKDFNITQLDKEVGSISFFVNIDDASTYTPIYYKGFDYSTPVPDAHRIAVNKGQLLVNVQSWRIEKSLENKIDQLKWHHIIIQWNTLERLGYILIDESKIEIDWTYFSQLIEDHPFSVGLLGKDYERTYVNHFGSAIPRYGNFKIDEIRVYDRWLSDEEIIQLRKN